MQKNKISVALDQHTMNRWYPSHPNSSRSSSNAEFKEKDFLDEVTGMKNYGKKKYKLKQKIWKQKKRI